jgi:hypothetical protein
MVIEKGKSYGDSIGSPVRIFSKAGAKDGLQVRIDDKLSRIAKGSEFQGDDTLKDLVGYLALLATDQEPKQIYRSLADISAVRQQDALAAQVQGAGYRGI